MNNHTSRVSIFFILCLLLCGKIAVCQKMGMYPPFTKWYQDPLGFKPIELSTAFGFAWGSAAVAACLIFTKNDSAFHKKLSPYTEEGYSFGYKFPYTVVCQHEVGLMYDVRKWMAIGVGGDALHFKDKINNSWAISVMPFARWYPLKTNKLKFFGQYGAGVSYSFKIFPLTGTGWEADTARTGTKFNLVSKYGIGTEIFISKKISFQASVKHFHLSNGNIKGVQRNPSHDSNGFYAGIIYKTN